MIINMTLFVQIFHFVMAYFIIKYFMLKPALVLIEQEEFEMQLLKQKLVQSEMILLKKKENKKNQWNSFYQELQKLSPISFKKPLKKEAPRIKPVILTAQENAYLSHEISQKIIKKIYS